MDEDLVPFEHWEKLDIRVGKILKVEDHPKADKLYILTVDLGEGKPRTIVAGLKKYCNKKEIEGKLGIFIINLEPATIRGIKSEGMILAAIGHQQAEACIIAPRDDMEVGSKVR